jgi:hypothetical protein
MRYSGVVGERGRRRRFVRGVGEGRVMRKLFPALIRPSMLGVAEVEVDVDGVGEAEDEAGDDVVVPVLLELALELVLELLAALEPLVLELLTLLLDGDEEVLVELEVLLRLLDP